MNEGQIGEQVSRLIKERRVTGEAKYYGSAAERLFERGDEVMRVGNIPTGTRHNIMHLSKSGFELV